MANRMMLRMDDTTDSRRSSGTWTLVMLVLAATCLMMRAMGVMALPIFGDEAIYLRWAQLIRGEGVVGGGRGGSHVWRSAWRIPSPLCITG